MVWIAAIAHGPIQRALHAMGRICYNVALPLPHYAPHYTMPFAWWSSCVIQALKGHSVLLLVLEYLKHPPASKI